MTNDSLDAFELKRLAAAWLPKFAQRGRFAEPPFVGYLLRPRRQEGGLIAIQGWVFSPVAPIDRLVLVAGPDQQLIPSGLARPDVAARFPDQLNAGRSGYSLLAPERRVDLEIWATMRGGRDLRCFVCPVALQ
jgi:hypothetical protein